MTFEEISKKCLPFTDDEKVKIDELRKEGCCYAEFAYSKSCMKKHLTELLSLVRKEGVQIYRNDEPLTKEQSDKWNKLVEMGWHDVASAYKQACNEENYVEEYKKVFKAYNKYEKI
jgi:Txe/YoeB family toxin of Txe-Axe toxin-antitoxin module